MQPGVEPVRITKSGQVPPGAKESFLDGVVREIGVPEDQACRCVQPRQAPIDEQREGVVIAPLRSVDDAPLVNGRLD